MTTCMRDGRTELDIIMPSARCVREDTYRTVVLGVFVCVCVHVCANVAHKYDKNLLSTII